MLHRILSRAYSLALRERVGVRVPLVLVGLFAVLTVDVHRSLAADAPKGYRKLGPGVETTIAADPNAQDTVTTHDVVEIQAAGKKLDWDARNAIVQRNPQGPYQRHSLPPRRLVLGVHVQAAANHQRRYAAGRWQNEQPAHLVHGLSVKNLGQHLEAEPAGDKNKSLAANQPMTDDIFFRPQFVLESPQFKKAYLDRVLPLAVEAIQKREDGKRNLLDTVQMGQQPIPLSTTDDDHSVWGVVTWEYIDPRIDFFNIYVKGLSNAYRFADPPGAYKLGDARHRPHGRPKDAEAEFLASWRRTRAGKGRNLLRNPGQVDHEWVFR